MAGSHEVVGSSPTSSTSTTGPVTIGSNPFRDRLGYWMDRAAAGEEIVITRHGKPRIRLSPAQDLLVPAAATLRCGRELGRVLLGRLQRGRGIERLTALHELQRAVGQLGGLRSTDRFVAKGQRQEHLAHQL